MSIGSDSFLFLNPSHAALICWPSALLLASLTAFYSRESTACSCADDRASYYGHAQSSVTSANC
eukprot:3781957-Pleurochrysis_carterae.AAC.1